MSNLPAVIYNHYYTINLPYCEGRDQIKEAINKIESATDKLLATMILTLGTLRIIKSLGIAHGVNDLTMLYKSIMEFEKHTWRVKIIFRKLH